MIKYEEELIKILKVLDGSGLLTKSIITGSWAMYFYTEMFENFEAPIATTDLDIFLPRVSNIKESNISELITDLNYVRDDDILTGKTRYYSKDGFEIEFLTLPNRTLSNVIYIKSINVGAEALPKLLPLTWNCVSVHFYGYDVQIPSPTSYCLQKILINNERSKDKQEKDISAIRYLLGFIGSSKKYKEEFVELFNTYPKKWKKIILKTIEQYNLQTPIKK